MSCVSPGAQARSASGPVPRPRKSGEREQPAADEVAREVLLADVDLSALPAVADLFQGGQHHLVQHLLEAECGEALVEHGVGGGLVVAANRCEQAGGRVLEQILGRSHVFECGMRSLRS